jgi:Rps23 Pro-64 3,4-dihydroxylase Tpa1-like proline 4-hydroxylase
MIYYEYMKRGLYTLVLAAALTAVLAFAAQTAQAQSTRLTAEQIDRIRSNCTSIKSTLNQLHASDALLRVNRGQVYESMASKLMDPFNSRLSNNRLDSKATSVVTQNYRTALDTFRSDYREYEVKLSSALRIDCFKEPELFHDTIAEARTLRAKVHEDVVKLHRHIDDYRTAVGDFLLNYERVAE